MPGLQNTDLTSFLLAHTLWSSPLWSGDSLSGSAPETSPSQLPRLPPGPLCCRLPLGLQPGSPPKSSSLCALSDDGDKVMADTMRALSACHVPGTVLTHNNPNRGMLSPFLIHR